MKNLKINVPEGYEIDKEASTFENIVFKKKEPCLPKRWEELKTIGGYYVSTRSNVESTGGDFNLDFVEDLNTMKNLFATREQAEASLALAQLTQLVKAYNNDWDPDWENMSQQKFTIIITRNSLLESNSFSFLAFKSAELRSSFVKNFKDLLLKVKPLSC